MKIEDIAKKIGAEISLYGKDMAKIESVSGEKCGKLVLVTAMTSNSSGIGKTTISIGLADALNLIGKRAVLALREPSIGPVFGIKGGATGGGKSSISPENEINLHFTGDFHAVAQANNLLSAIIDNHIFQGNVLKIDVKQIFFKRCLDVNDRSLREISYQIKGKEVVTGFNITAASEVMAVLCLSENLEQLKENLGNILVALTEDGKPVFARDLHAEEAMTILLKEAIKPDLVQSLAGTPAIVHLGPFANIAHGCNSVVATRMALSSADFCVTEAGFGSDLGAEKFLDIKCRRMGIMPDVAVLVVTLNVVKEHGNGNLTLGFENVKRHIFNLKTGFNLPCVVAINQHNGDSVNELEMLRNLCEKEGVEACVCQPFEMGGQGCFRLAEIVNKKSCEKHGNVSFCYELSDKILEKIEKIATKVYGAGKVEFSPLAMQKIELANALGFGDFFVNVAKTQFSFADDKKMLGAPNGFTFHVSDIEIRSGARMIVAIAGDMLLMPGLGKQSNYLKMAIDDAGEISGLF